MARALGIARVVIMATNSAAALDLPLLRRTRLGGLALQRRSS
jgi:hypothetical protein